MSSVSHATIYTAASGALVFSAGTMYFPWRVDSNEYASFGADGRAQQIVRNVLNRMVGSAPATPTPTLVPLATPTPTPIRTATPILPTATPTVPPSCSTTRPAV